MSTEGEDTVMSKFVARVMQNKKLAALLLLLPVCFVVEYFLLILLINDLNSQKTVSAPAPLSNNRITESATDIANKDYTGAIDTMTTAIADDPYTAEYYSVKAEAEYLNGDKTAAIATVNEGLRVDPENELLKSKLDVLEKDTFNSSDGSGGRE